jgi:glucose-1-phosphate adenylyltransferase
LDSVIGHNVFVHSYAQVEDSILFSDTDIGQHVRIRNAIIDKCCVIEKGVEIGYDKKSDSKNFTVTPQGRVVVPKWTRITPDGEMVRLEGPYSPKEEDHPHASTI